MRQTWAVGSFKTVNARILIYERAHIRALFIYERAIREKIHRSVGFLYSELTHPTGIPNHQLTQCRNRWISFSWMGICLLSYYLKHICILERTTCSLVLIWVAFQHNLQVNWEIPYLLLFVSPMISQTLLTAHIKFCYIVVLKTSNTTT